MRRAGTKGGGGCSDLLWRVSILEKGLMGRAGQVRAGQGRTRWGSPGGCPGGGVQEKVRIQKPNSQPTIDLTAQTPGTQCQG